MVARSEKKGTTLLAAGPEGEATFRGRLRRYGPLVLWMALIFFASTGELSATNTSRIVRPLLLWLFPGITEDRLACGRRDRARGTHPVARSLQRKSDQGYGMSNFTRRLSQNI
ncbi:MAG: hypothetical protein LC672_02110 [Acidobacteria bacterium]|nr:hypothetical protein [Acidobacteriota bacterium]